MTLKQKTLAIIGLMFVSLVVVLYAILRTALVREFNRHDAAHAVRDAELARSALEYDLANLAATADDWASWDDTYAFVKDANPAYVESNLVDGTFLALRLNLMAFVDRSGRIVWAKAFDLEGEQEMPVPADFHTHLRPGSPLVNRQAEDDATSGVLMLADGNMLVAAHPILTSLDEGPARGTLILGRYLTAREVSRIAQRSALALSVSHVDDADAPADARKIRDTLSLEIPATSQILDHKTIAGYVLMKDIYARPALLVRVESLRESYAQGLVTTRYMAAGMVALVLLFGALILVMLEKSVLAPIANLVDSVRDIGEAGDFARRVSVRGRDELATLGGAVNRMLDALESAHRRYRDLFDRVPVGLYRTQPDGTVLDANPALAHMLGYSEVGELMRVNAMLVHASPDQREQEHALLAQTGTARDVELQLRRADGDLIWAQDTVRAVRGDDGNVLYYEGSLINITERKQAEEERERLINDLQKALSEVKTLSGLLPICAACKKIRDDRGYWRQVEEYVSEHTLAEFTHSLCPDCMRRLYPEFFREEGGDSETEERT